MKKNVRRIATATAAAALSIGLLGSTAPAQADTSWGGYRVVEKAPKDKKVESRADTSWGGYSIQKSGTTA